MKSRQIADMVPCFLRINVIWEEKPGVVMGFKSMPGRVHRAIEAGVMAIPMPVSAQERLVRASSLTHR